MSTLSLIGGDSSRGEVEGFQGRDAHDMQDGFNDTLSSPSLLLLLSFSSSSRAAGLSLSSCYRFNNAGHGADVAVDDTSGRLIGRIKKQNFSHPGVKRWRREAFRPISSTCPRSKDMKTW